MTSYIRHIRLHTRQIRTSEYQTPRYPSTHQAYIIFPASDPHHLSSIIYHPSSIIHLYLNKTKQNFHPSIHYSFHTHEILSTQQQTQQTLQTSIQIDNNSRHQNFPRRLPSLVYSPIAQSLWKFSMTLFP